MTPTPLEVTFRPETEAQQRALLQLAADWPHLGMPPKANSLTSKAEHVNAVATTETAVGTSIPTLQEVRLRLTQLSRAGKADAVKGLLKKFGANSLTELDPAHYAAVLAAGGAL
jgi:hypothetical protein